MLPGARNLHKEGGRKHQAHESLNSHHERYIPLQLFAIICSLFQKGLR